MTSDRPRFPVWFVSDCPPVDSGDAHGMIYRFVAEIPVVPNDFRSYFETGERPLGLPCQRCGLSVFRDPRDIRELLQYLWRRYPGKTYGSHIVRRELKPADGKLKATGSRGHHSWWAYEGVERHASFEFVETVEKS